MSTDVFCSQQGSATLNQMQFSLMHPSRQALRRRGAAAQMLPTAFSSCTPGNQCARVARCHAEAAVSKPSLKQSARWEPCCFPLCRRSKMNISAPDRRDALLPRDYIWIQPMSKVTQIKQSNSFTLIT